MAGMIEISKACGCKSADVEAVFTTIIDMIKNGEEVRIKNFGTFSKKHREAREGRNPATGEAVQIAAKDSLHFKASKGVDVSAPKASRRR